MKRFTNRPVLALLILLGATVAQAADEPDELIPVDFALFQPFRRLRVVVERPPGTFDVPNPANDPTVEGGTLRAFTYDGDDNTYDLPASGWSAVAGGFRYQGAGTYEDPCTQIDVRDDRIDVECEGTGVTLTSPAFVFGVILAIGTDTKRYCARMDVGSFVRNGTRLLTAENAPAPPACPAAPVPVDRLEAGRIVYVQPGKVARIMAEHRTAPTFDMPPLPDQDPLAVGGSLRIFDTGSAAGDVTFPLPAPGWTVSAGLRGYMYRGAGTPSDPCSVIRLAPRRLKGICRGTAVALSPPFAGEAAVRLSIGATRYCMEFGGTTVDNSTQRLVRRGAPTAPGCASPSGAFLEMAADLWDIP